MQGVCHPFFLIFMFVPGIPHFTARLISLLIFYNLPVLLMRWMDIYYCKKDHLVTDFGKFKSFADKLLVSSALIFYCSGKQCRQLL